MADDPKVIYSRHNGFFTRDGVTVEINICRLVDTRWSLEVVDKQNTSIVWDDEFETDDAAYAEFMQTVERDGMLEFQPPVSDKIN